MRSPAQAGVEHAESRTESHPVLSKSTDPARRATLSTLLHQPPLRNGVREHKLPLEARCGVWSKDVYGAVKISRPVGRGGEAGAKGEGRGVVWVGRI